MAHSDSSYGCWLEAYLELLKIVLWLCSMWPLYLAYAPESMGTGSGEITGNRSCQSVRLMPGLREFQNITYTAFYYSNLFTDSKRGWISGAIFGD